MTTSFAPSYRHARLLLAVVILLARLAAVPGSPAHAMDLVGGSSAICLAAGSAAAEQPEPAGQTPAGHTHDCVLCPVCSLADAAPALSPSRIALDVPARLGIIGPGLMRRTDGLSRLFRHDAVPRGPPAFVV